MIFIKDEAKCVMVLLQEAEPPDPEDLSLGDEVESSGMQLTRMVGR